MNSDVSALATEPLLESVAWLKDELQALGPSVEVTIHVTGTASVPANECDREGHTKEGVAALAANHFGARPHFASIIEQELEATEGTLAIGGGFSAPRPVLTTSQSADLPPSCQTVPTRLLEPSSVSSRAASLWCRRFSWQARATDGETPGR